MSHIALQYPPGNPAAAGRQPCIGPQLMPPVHGEPMVAGGPASTPGPAAHAPARHCCCGGQNWH